MAEYLVTGRLKTADGVIHEVGETVELPDADAAVFARMRVIEPVVAPAPQPQPNLADLQKEAADLEQQIANMEHEGGAAS